MSYPTARYGRQSVSNDESLVLYVQNPRFDVSDSDVESYLRPDEGTYLDHHEATYSDHDEGTYLDPDEETDSIDDGQDNPRYYGVCPGKFAPDATSNDHYRCGNSNFDYIKAFWPETIPRHYTWEGEYPADELRTLETLDAKIWPISLREMSESGHWVPYSFLYRQGLMPYIATITYSDSNPLVTLSYALLRRPGDELSVVGFKLDLASRPPNTVVSRWHVVGEGKRDTNDKNTEDIQVFERPPTPREGDTELEWSAVLCEWWVPDCTLHGMLHFPGYEVVKRSNYRSSRGTGHRHRVRR